ncbi:hypothetical protein [Streptomyces sp. NPDC048565]|uniref:hypothetical protein n=1 Tax=Streptomyces sp. NPDC048565 TaxID=3155266 RepID=UPI003426813E
MATHLVDTAETDEEIGRCYTKARRAPLVHGVIRDVNGGRGIRLPGGPYTLTQLAAIVSTFVVLILTRAVWGGHGLLDVGLLLGLPFAAAFALRHLHIDGRNPAAALVSVMTMLTGPRWGRLHGRPLRPTRPTREDIRITLAAPDGPRLSPAAPEVFRDSAPAPAPNAALADHLGTPALGAAVGPAVASGVQALLARRTASTDEKEK